MNTVLIDKIVIHMFDMEHSQIIFSNALIDLVEGTTEYYDKKIEKTLFSSVKKEILVGSQHALLQAGRDMILGEESFLLQASSISEELFSIVKQIDGMPNSNLLFVECKVDGKKHILIMKLNYKQTPVSIIEEIDGVRKIRFVNQQTLPPKSSNVEEAIIINVEDEKVSIIEKRFVIDGKPGYYLNEQYIKGEPKLTDKQKISLVTKVVKKLDQEFNVNEASPVAHLKQEVVNLVMENQPVKPVELAKKVLQSDYNAAVEAEELMHELGINDDDLIVNVPGNIDKMARCKLVLDNDRVIELDVDDYLDKRDIEITVDSSGMTSITIANIEDIVVK